MKKNKFSELLPKNCKLEDNWIYKDSKKICNFWIKKLTANVFENNALSYTMTLRFYDEDYEATFPACLLYDATGWLQYFPEDKWILKCSKRLFNSTMAEIIGSMHKNNAVKHKENFIGWEEDKDYHNIFFNYIDNPLLLFDEKCEKNETKYNLYDYINVADHHISVPIISYMLLSILNFFEIFQKNRRPEFILSITGATPPIRARVALFFSNLYKRITEPYAGNYSHVHITEKDSLGDMLSKSKYLRDCVLICFEPEENQRKYLEKIYIKEPILKDDVLIRNLCLITAPSKESIGYETYNINLENDYKTPYINSFFYNDELTTENDELLDIIYNYIITLIINLKESKNFIRKQYDSFKSHSIKYYENLSEPAKRIARYLCFALWLYFIVENKIENFSEDAIEIICEIANTSFPVPLTEEEKLFNETKEFCNIIDSFFSKKEFFDRIGIIGKTNSNTLIWCSKKNMYITATDANLIFSTKNSESKFNRLKRFMAKKNFIVTFKKANDQLEYTLPIGKCVFENHKITKRHITFNVEECRKYNLFPFLTKYIDENAIDDTDT